MTNGDFSYSQMRPCNDWCLRVDWLEENRMNFYCITEHCSCIGIKQFSAGKAIRCTAESCKNKSEPSCGSCKWYAEPEGVCVNDQSEHVADFVWDERGCKEWEKKDEL